MNKYPLTVLLVFHILLTSYSARAEEATAIPSPKPSKILFYNATGTIRAESVLTSKELKQDQKTIYHVTQVNHGDYDKYQNVSWIIESFSERMPDESLRPLRTLCTVMGQDGKTVSHQENHFDYEDNIIRVILKDSVATKNYTYPIKGKTADYATLKKFLQSYIGHLDEPNYKNFYLLTSEPKLYKVNIKLVAKETLKSPFGELPALKLRLIADMSILDDVFDRYVPATYIWYEEQPPHRWLKYQGMETGYRSAVITAYAGENKE